MYRSVLTLRTTPERAQEILELYRAEKILQESLDATRQISSDIAVSDDGEVIVTANWPDENGYQEWLDHPQRTRTAPELNALLEGAEVGIGKLYKIDHGVSRN
ncbi:hypothetical protein MHJ85_06540 [Brevibacterium ravenspurgense]|uniref:hypothetical protein n=1 Tax=Brevibacterium ravenspurgense TaxID=479117 RepID=UPI001EF344F2|nr:hypothetical protein [Brevibacterium ravenspurgense]MCG7300918.1 hypothetical protein [Brevibacterium ravenspurgense]